MTHCHSRHVIYRFSKGWRLLENGHRCRQISGLPVYYAERLPKDKGRYPFILKVGSKTVYL